MRMASIIDSAKLVFTDDNAITKIAILSVIPFTIYNLLNENFKLSSLYDLNTPLIAILGITYYGYLTQTLNNSLKEKTYILSSLNPFISFWYGLKGIISSFIFLYPIYFVYEQITPLTSDFPQTSAIILMAIAYIIATSFLLMSIILYGKEFKITSGLNLMKIAKNFHEIIVYIALSVVLLALFNIITALPFGGIIYGLFGEGRIFEYTASIILTNNLLLFFQSLSHAYFQQVKE